ncbi:DUF418 domain-containing protein [Salmonella enterica subsp. enterica]|nr:DUF418 domain-containing protein [Salmonella enterica subsp. enterica]
MALTNYLLQTIICTTLFFISLKAFMKFNRLELLFFVVPVAWAINASLFRHLATFLLATGTGQWLWRQLTLRASGSLR